GAKVFNLYRGPTIKRGNAAGVGMWLNHVEKVYPTDHQHIVKFLAHRVQRPGQKINHVLLLGGPQGIGKDTVIEPGRQAVGPWNCQDISPSAFSAPYNGFAKAVILRISEAHDLGDLNRFQFYEVIKVYTTTPPDVIRINDKYIRQFYIRNVCGVI